MYIHQFKTVSALFVLSLIANTCLADPIAPIRVENYTPPVRVACIGDSITFGSLTPNPAVDSYPAQLNRMLDKKWEVRNYGVSGATLLNKGDKPYQLQSAFQQALDFKPDVVVIMLGTNDTKPQNWKLKSEFVSDYKQLIGKFKALESKPKIFICDPVPVTGAGAYGINEPGIKQEKPMIDKVAKEENAGVIDLYKALAGHSALIPDHVHPDAAGATLMAKTVFKALTGNEFNGAVPAEKSKAR